MTRFTKRFVLSLAVASLALAGTMAVQAQETAKMARTVNRYSLEGGYWVSGNDAKKAAVGLKFQSGSEVRVIMVENEQKVYDKVCRYSYENGRLQITFDDGSSLKGDVTFDNHDNLTLIDNNGKKSTWKRITN